MTALLLSNPLAVPPSPTTQPAVHGRGDAGSDPADKAIPPDQQVKPSENAQNSKSPKDTGANNGHGDPQATNPSNKNEQAATPQRTRATPVPPRAPDATASSVVAANSISEQDARASALAAQQAARIEALLDRISAPVGDPADTASATAPEKAAGADRATLPPKASG